MKARVFPLAAACLLSVTPQATGQGQLDQEIASLAGLSLVFLIVQVDTEGRDAGLSAETLLARLVTRLHEARIRTTTDTSAFLAAENRKPALAVSVNALEIRGWGWASSLDLSLWQQACVTHPPSETGVLCSQFRTWSDRRILTSGREELPRFLLETLDEQLDLFVMHYLRANPDAR